MRLRIRTWHAVLAVVLLGALGLFYLPEIREYLERQPFDSLQWRKSLAEEQTNPIRIRMIDDLLSRYDLNGMSRAEIHDLLGKPPKTSYFPDYEYVYWLGPERGFIRIDSEWLGLQFDPSDRVSKVSLLRD